MKWNTKFLLICCSCLLFSCKQEQQGTLTIYNKSSFKYAIYLTKPSMVQKPKDMIAGKMSKSYTLPVGKIKIYCAIQEKINYMPLFSCNQQIFNKNIRKGEHTKIRINTPPYGLYHLFNRSRYAHYDVFINSQYRCSLKPKENKIFELSIGYHMVNMEQKNASTYPPNSFIFNEFIKPARRTKRAFS